MKSELEKKLLEEIPESLFSENSIFQFCVDNDVDIGTVTMILNELIDDGKVHKLYYCPYEERTSTEAIGCESYPIFTIKLPVLNIDELMKGL